MLWPWLFEDENNLHGITFFSTLFLLIIWAILIKKPFVLDGYLLLSKSEIEFISNDRQKSFKLTEISHIKLVYIGYRWKGHISSQSFDSGLGNTLKIKIGESTYCFELYLEDLRSTKTLFNIIKEWDSKTNVKITNFIGLKVKNP